MSWKKKKTLYGKNKNYSVCKKLKKENLIDDRFEIMVNNLSLENLIAIKLELAAKSAGGYLYGMPIWRSLKYIVEDAVLKYALSSTRTKNEALRFLGLKIREYKTLQKTYKTESFFEENE